MSHWHFHCQFARFEFWEVKFNAMSVSVAAKCLKRSLVSFSGTFKRAVEVCFRAEKRMLKSKISKESSCKRQDPSLQPQNASNVLEVTRLFLRHFQTCFCWSLLSYRKVESCCVNNEIRLFAAKCLKCSRGLSSLSPALPNVLLLKFAFVQRNEC